MDTISRGTRHSVRYGTTVRKNSVSDSSGSKTGVGIVEYVLIELIGKIRPPSIWTYYIVTLNYLVIGRIGAKVISDQKPAVIC